MNWKKLRSSTTATNLNFQSFCELGKSLKYSLRPTFKNPNFKSKDELSSTVENKGIYNFMQFYYQTNHRLLLLFYELIFLM